LIGCKKYFGEEFNPLLCRKTCDNCEKDLDSVEKDVTQEAKWIVDLVGETQGDKVTMLHIMDVFRGLKHSKIMDLGHDSCRMYGKGKSWKKQETERLLRLLIIKQIIMERVELNGMGFPVTYVKLGPKSRLPNTEKIMLTITSEDDSSLGAKASERSRSRRSMDSASVASVGSSEPELQMNCYKELKQLRDDLAESNGLNPSQVFKDSTILAMSQRYPTTLDEFRGLPGVNDMRCNTYGVFFLDITQKYSLLIQEERSKATE
jgi:superfamily II DNA helicase RecQ